MCRINLNITAPKIRALQMGPKTENGDFLEIAVTISIEFQKLMETVSPNKSTQAASSGN
jgi:hypothetical protein